MIDNLKIGASLAKQSPWALLLTGLIFLMLFLNQAMNINNVIYAVLLGQLTSVTLLAYWHGKGGIFFIMAVLAPLVLIIVTELPTFIALAWVINGFFFGMALLLFFYHMYVSKLNK
ncbi:hypothetical protein [Pseudoalteromonas aurantia]|uniref:Uncharacterized protein n=1 Tax=Pseudoalteromonas aurantia 208 TaxID=1314867 RepID=A0ABR9EDK3_9GAMM|nr:hypothetical protein [Pseudoalteromonas aurantia]MBE0369071.1 hypothetical protein [Pseudoalteromonas aurantia 208]